MKFLLVLCALVPFCTSELIVDSGDSRLLMQDFHNSIYDSVRVRREANPQQQGHVRQQQPQEPQVQYRPYSQVPAQIKQLVQFQQIREPVINLPAQPVPNLAATGSGHGNVAPANQQHQSAPQGGHQAIGAYRPNVQYGNAPQQPNYQNQAAAIAAQYRPQGQPQGQPQYQPQGQHQGQPQGQPQYNPQYQG